MADPSPPSILILPRRFSTIFDVSTSESTTITATKNREACRLTYGYGQGIRSGEEASKGDREREIEREGSDGRAKRERVGRGE